jgi:mRNA-degrading endonuclease RelE of RelBE toxin-antitoxin system
MCYGKQCMEVTITPSAAREFDELPPTIQGRMIGMFERLKNYPAVSGVKPLRGKLAGRFRMRTGDYRVQFHVERNRVIVEKVGHRDRFYEG